MGVPIALNPRSYSLFERKGSASESCKVIGMFDGFVQTLLMSAELVPWLFTEGYGIIKGGWFKGGGYRGSLGNLRGSLGSIRE